MRKHYHDFNAIEFIDIFIFDNTLGMLKSAHTFLTCSILRRHFFMYNLIKRRIFKNKTRGKYFCIMSLQFDR